MNSEASTSLFGNMRVCGDMRAPLVRRKNHGRKHAHFPSGQKHYASHPQSRMFSLYRARGAQSNAETDAVLGGRRYVEAPESLV